MHHNYSQPIGQVLLYVAAEDASVGKTAVQSETLQDRFADYAVDGNNNGTNLSTCTLSFYYDELTRYSRAWWQVNMGDFYLVKVITVYFPTVPPGEYAIVFAHCYL